MYGKYNQITATRRHCWIGFHYHCWIGYLLRWCWKIHLLEFLPLQQDGFHVHELPCHLFDLWRSEGNQPPLCLPTDYRIFFHGNIYFTWQLWLSDYNLHYYQICLIPNRVKKNICFRDSHLLTCQGIAKHCFLESVNSQIVINKKFENFLEKQFMLIHNNFDFKPVKKI